MSTGIEWTDETWNPVVGCQIASPGCDNCYAAREAAGRLSTHPLYAGLATRAAGESAKFTGEVRTVPERLEQPLRWARPRRIFVNSMSDLFHPAVPDEFIDRVYDVMARASQHQFQVLTKRPQRMAAWANATEDTPEVPVEDRALLRPPLPNVWLGTSVENQRYADMRVPHLLATPAAVRFLSVEPLLGPVTLDADWLPKGVSYPTDYGTGREWDIDRNGCIDWVIVGGESGPRARPMHPDWARSLRDECTAAGVPFLFKQWGEFAPTGGRAGSHRVCFDGSWYPNPPTCVMSNEELIDRVGKKAAGRELDGRTWDEFPA